MITTIIRKRELTLIYRLLLVAIFLGLSACAHAPNDRHTEESRLILEELSDVCYSYAHESIYRTVRDVRALLTSMPSPIRSRWGGDVFFSNAGPPKSWGGMPTQTFGYGGSTDRAYELRYTYTPIERYVLGKKVIFHGVNQQIFDFSTNELMAERSNYIFGGDFNRGRSCLGASWYGGNDSFAERVLGPRYLDQKTGKRQPDRKPETYVKSRLVKIENIETRGATTVRSVDALPVGSEYDYNHRTIRLPAGSFYMPSYRNQEPIPIVETIEMPEHYVFVMLPDGWMRSESIRQLLFMYRTKTGELVKSLFVQIPPGYDWTNGWGINPGDIDITDAQITFRLLGKKKVVSEFGYPTRNRGEYFKRYTYVVDLQTRQ